MLHIISAPRYPIPFQPDEMVIVQAKDTAGKKEEIRFALRNTIDSEYRKYLKAKKLKAAGPSFTHEQFIHFRLDRPNPRFDKEMIYRLQFGPDGLIVSPEMHNSDPEVAPFVRSVNLSQVKNEFFDPADYVSRPRRIILAPTALPPEIPQVNEDSAQPPVIALPEIRFITACRAPFEAVGGEPRPYIRFGGQYLERFGFTIGAPITMLLEQNKITLTVAETKPINKQTA